jgi:hypothetical protein
VIFWFFKYTLLKAQKIKWYRAAARHDLLVKGFALRTCALPGGIDV